MAIEVYYRASEWVERLVVNAGVERDTNVLHVQSECWRYDGSGVMLISW